jgi:hypothetical protein
MKECFKLDLFQPWMLDNRKVHEASLIHSIFLIIIVFLLNHIFTAHLIQVSIHHKIKIKCCSCCIIHVAFQPKSPEKLLVMIWIREWNQINWAVTKYILFIELFANSLYERIQINDWHRSLRKEISTTSVLLGEKLVVGSYKCNFSIRFNEKRYWHRLNFIQRGNRCCLNNSSN